MTARHATPQRLTVAGHICVDLSPPMATPLPDPGGLAAVAELQIGLGGCVANVGVALAQLGVPAQVVAAVGDDLLGTVVAQRLGESGLSTRLARVPSVATSYSIVIEPPGEDRRFLHHVGANVVFDRSALPSDPGDLVHVGYPQHLPALWRRGGAGLAELLQQISAGRATTSVDFATVDARASGQPDWAALVRSWAPLIDVLTPSIDDLAPCFPDVDPSMAPATSADVLAGRLVELGAAVVIVTAGSAGLILRSGPADRLARGGRVLASVASQWADRQLYAPAPTVPVRQSTGAGDRASAAVLAALVHGEPPERALSLAAAAAALHVAGASTLPQWHHLSVAPSAAAIPPAHQVSWQPAGLAVLSGPLDRKPR